MNFDDLLTLSPVFVSAYCSSVPVPTERYKIGKVCRLLFPPDVNLFQNASTRQPMDYAATQSLSEGERSSRVSRLGVRGAQAYSQYTNTQQGPLMSGERGQPWRTVNVPLTHPFHSNKSASSI